MEQHETAGDEAKQIQDAKRPMVRVTCSLPQGLVLNNHLDKDGKPTSAANWGPGSPIEVRGSQPVDKAFYDAWAENNKDLVARGVVSAVPIEEEEDGEAVGSEGAGGPEQDLDPPGEAKDA
jgi:hypothetical protein